VENLSYAFDGTDPVSGVQYGAWARVGYTALGAVELVLTATGFEAAGKGLLQETKIIGKTVTTEIVQQESEIAAKSLLKSCFLAGTLISRYSLEDEHYRELVPIENIRHGDKVWSYNLKTHHWEPRLVLETFRRNYVGDVVFVQFENEKIDTTGGHPFWVIDGNDLENRPLCDCLPCTEQNLTPYGRWVYARDLQIGDTIQSRVQESYCITDLTIETNETLVYNFLVDDLHNYAVGEYEILVHNTNSPPKAGGQSQKTGAGRSDPHGDSGRARSSSQTQIENYEKEIERLKQENVPGRRKIIQDLEQKIKHVRQNADNKAKGETHWRRGK
jgi:hypothetical protein